MFSFVPAANLPTVSTTGSSMSTRRVTSVCSAVTISQATGIGSSVRCGADACPPTPTTRTTNSSEAAISGPGRENQVPSGRPEDITCRQYAASAGRPAASRTPSSIIAIAPAVVSSAGCHISTTSPAQLVPILVQQPGRPDHGQRRAGRARRRASAPGARRRTAARSPRATGSASMSPRSSTTGPVPSCAPPRSTAVTELSAVPVVISRSSPSSASSTSACVFGSSRSSSGTRCSCRRRAIRSGAIARARSSTGSMAALLPIVVAPAHGLEGRSAVPLRSALLRS